MFCNSLLVDPPSALSLFYLTVKATSVKFKTETSGKHKNSLKNDREGKKALPESINSSLQRM